MNNKTKEALEIANDAMADIDSISSILELTDSDADLQSKIAIAKDHIHQLLILLENLK